MNDADVNNLFQFIAVRPPQLVSERESAQIQISDPRIRDEDEFENLRNSVSQYADTGLAQALWDDYDLSWPKVLHEFYATLRRHYRGLMDSETDPPSDPPVGRELIQSLDADVAGGLEYSPELEIQMWDLLYLAYSLGNNSGDKVTYPLAGLRLIYFWRVLGWEPQPSPDRAIHHLDSTVLLFPEYTDLIRSGRVYPVDDSSEAERAPDPGHIEKLRALARDIVAAHRLLEEINKPHQAAGPGTVRSVPPGADWTTRVEVSTLPLAKDVIPEKLTSGQAELLDLLEITAQTPLPAVHQLLTDHSQKLAHVAESLGDDPQFQSAYNRERGQIADSGVKLTSGDLLKPIPDELTWIPYFPPEPSDTDMSGLIQPLGVGDLKVVKQTLLAYVAGEVSHIENVMNGESKSRTHRKLDRTEVTIFQATEENKESERDVQTTDRFDLKDETSKVLNSNTSLSAGLSVTAKYGPVETTVTGNFATTSAKEESTKNSSSYSREVVDKAVTKVQSKVREERTTKTITEVEEINVHTLEGKRPDGSHTVGIYRWVDKKYRAQVYNYGQRLMLEFIVPEPSLYRRTSWENDDVEVGVKPPPALLNYYQADGSTTPFNQRVELNAAHISETNYELYAAKFGATDVAPIPPVYATVSTSLGTPQHIEDGKSFSLRGDEKFATPEGYALQAITFGVSSINVAYPSLIVHILGIPLSLLTHSQGHTDYVNRPGATDKLGTFDSADPAVAAISEISDVQGVIPVALTGYDVISASATFTGYCRRTRRAEAVWRLGTYKAIKAAWQTQQGAYEQAVSEAKQRKANEAMFQQGQNPLASKRELETELKKLCISMMTGEHYDHHNGYFESSTEIHPINALRDGRISQFFEQAFEWEQMTYLFYPYFWGRKSKWRDYQHLTDPDPLYQSFLNAGAARVVVPVPLPYKNDVIYLLCNPNGATDLSSKVWMGGDLPHLSDPRYRSIAEEFRDQTDDIQGATPEGEPWEYKVPTTLVWLQQDDDMPISFEPS